MANFTVNVPFTIVTGTAASDTFNLIAVESVLGLEGDDAFSAAAPSASLFLDGGAGSDIS